MECEDCASFAVGSPELMSLVDLYGEISAVTICVHCQRPIIDSDLTEKVIASLIRRGVKCISWSEDE